MEPANIEQTSGKLGSAKQSNKILIILGSIIVLLLMSVIFLAVQNQKLQTDLEIARITPTPIPDYNELYPTRVVETPTILDVCTLGDLRCDFNLEKFEILKTERQYTDDSGRERYLPQIEFRKKGTNDVVLSIIDRSGSEARSMDVKRIVRAMGADSTPHYTHIPIEGKTYDFVRTNWGEGYPTNEDGSCWAGGGYYQDFTTIANDYIVEVTTHYSSEGCNGEKIQETTTVDAETEKEIRAIIHSIKISQRS